MELNDLQETAGLARLIMSEQELQTLSPAFDQLISLLSTMETAGSDIAMPPVTCQADFVTTSAKPVNSDWFRPDTEQPTPADTIEFMLSQAPKRDGNFIVIPNVL